MKENKMNLTINRVHTFSNFFQSLLQLGCCCVRLLSRLRVSVAVAVGEADEKQVEPQPNLEVVLKATQFW